MVGDYPVRGFTVFETLIGSCGIAWSAGAIVGVQLPEGSAEDTAARLEARFPGFERRAATGAAKQALEAIVALLDGEAVDLGFVPLDIGGVSAFRRRVYETVRTIPAGAVRTYGEVARQLGAPRAARAVGQALGANPVPIIVPCHRVLATGGTGGFTAAGGVATKLQMLRIEERLR